MKTGFTLIELLVVVLIIGILSAVALPQYQKAVNKSRVSQILVTLDAARKAEMLYFLQEGRHGLFAGNFEDASLVGMDVPRPNVKFPKVPDSSLWAIDLLNDNSIGIGVIDEFRFGVTLQGEYFCCEGYTEASCKDLGFAKRTVTYDPTMTKCFAL